MVLADKAPWLRRFAKKLVEMAAAGIGTAVSGYLAAYVTAHFSLLSLFTPAAVAPKPPPAISSPAAPHETALKETRSVEDMVRAALASHDGNRAAPVAAAPQPATLASATPAAPESTALALAPPLATAEINSLPVVASVDATAPAGPEEWPSDPRPVSGGGRLPIIGTSLPPQPPPVNGNLFAAFKHFF